MSELKSTFQKKPLLKKNIKNYFDNENFDRSSTVRNDIDWYEKLDKNDKNQNGENYTQNAKSSVFSEKHIFPALYVFNIN